MKVLVTGATGFLGSGLCQTLNAAGHEIVALGSEDADLTKQGSLDTFSDQSFDLIYHLAAWTQAGDFCVHHPGEQWIINQQINTNVLEWWHRLQPAAKLISIGTSCAYSPENPYCEENYLVGQPIESLYSYAMTKRMLYVGLRSLHRQYRMRYLYVVPSTLYGPGYHTDNRQMHFIFDLIRKILRAKLCGKPAILWGDGHQKRELVYRDDFISSLETLSSSTNNELVNIGSGEEYSIRTFVQIICEIVDYQESRIIYDTSRYVGARSKCLNVAHLDSLLPNRHQTSLRDGLMKTIYWMKETFYPDTLKN